MPQISGATFADRDLARFAEMSLSEYGPSDVSDSKHIRWKHLDSPFGASFYVCLVESGRVVGRVMVQPRPLRTISAVRDVGFVGDLLIDRQHRKTPMSFINITRACGDAPSVDLLYHTSNEQSFPLYSGLFHFANPFSLRSFGFPIRFAGLLASLIGRRVNAIDWFAAPLRWILVAVAFVVRLIAGLHISQRAMSDDELEQLCMKCLRRSGPHLARTNAFLKWRFGDAPLYRASIFRLDGKGHFLGYAVTRKVKLGSLDHFILMDFLLDPDTPLLIRVALRLWLMRMAIASKADAVFTMVNPFSDVARKCVGFPLLGISDKVLPHATPIFVRARSNDSKEWESDRSIHFTLADLDYF
jgi:hypothetical protein